MSSARSSPSIAGICLLLVGLTVFTYWPVLNHGFVNWDDMEHAARNPDIAGPTFGSVKRYWTAPYFGLWIPVTYNLWQATAVLSNSSDGALNPVAFHGLNLGLHALATLLVFLIVRRIVPGNWPAAFGAAVFGVHPIQVEVVAWVSAMRDGLAGMLSLLAVWTFLRAGDSSGRRRAWQYAGASGIFVLALLSKPTSAVAPVILTAILWGITPRPILAGRWLLAWFALAATDLAIAWIVQPSGDVYHAPVWARPIVALDAIGFYLGKLLVPSDFLIDYGRSPDWLLAHLSAWWMAGVALLIASALIVFRRRIPVFATAGAIFAGGLLPVLGLLPFGFQYFSTVADRYVYLSMLGVATACAAAAAALPLRRIWVSLAAIVVALGISANRQTLFWQTTASLCDHTLSVNPRSVAALRILTFEAIENGDWAKALEYNGRALRVKPDDGLLLFDRANALRDSGRITDAEDAYAAALAKRPFDTQLRNNYAVLLAQQGHDADAETQFKEVLRQAPHYAEGRANWGTFLAMHGRRDEALAAFSRALEDDSRCIDARRGIESLQRQ